MTVLFKNYLLVLQKKILKNGFVIVEDGIIKNFGSGKLPLDQKYDHVYDGHGKYLAPGFVDIHVHGANGTEFIDGTKKAYINALETHLKGGTTTIVPTFSASPADVVLKSIDVFNKIKKEEDRYKKIPRLAGIHMEGPYLSPEQAGAQDPGVIHPPKKSEYEKFLNSTDYIIRWSNAPELKGALAFGKYLYNKGIGVSVGHSNATTAQVDKAFENGYKSITHLYSSCSIVHRNGPFREGGVVEAGLKNKDMDVEIIADGAHLPKELLQLIYGIKGPEHIALVTDCIRCGGLEYPDGTVLPYSKSRNINVTIKNNVAIMPGGKSFAGSLATTSHLVRTMVNLAEVKLVDAVYMASAVPARLIGKDDKIGTISCGKFADFTILNEELYVTDVFISGIKKY